MSDIFGWLAFGGMCYFGTTLALDARDGWRRHRRVVRAALAADPATLPPAVRDAVEAYRRAEKDTGR